jgi:glycerol-3-phosphate cytidylyltransferase
MTKKFIKFDPIVFVPMSADLIHHGHINILKKAKKLGRVIVGLMTDKGIFSYKKKLPLLKYSERKMVVESIKYVDKIIPIPGLKYVEYAKKYKFNFFVHGDDWKSGVQSDQRKKLHLAMKKWDGKVIDIAYTRGVSSSKLKKNKIC